MNIYIVIPAHNEEDFIGKTLESLAQQTLLPKKLVVVADNCTDNTLKITQQYARRFAYIEVVQYQSSEQHLPGSKVINAFNKGFEILDEDYDLICKFDADLIFPKNYLKTLAHHFIQDERLGIAGGFCYVENNSEWILENITNKDHIRGALKTYRKQCFEDIGKLKASIGWDTVDELLAKFYNWNVQTDASLKVKHLRPTGSTYNQNAKLLQGEAMYKMRYGFVITWISAIKIAFKKKKISIISDYLKGYNLAKSNNIPFLVNEEQGAFIRHLRWKGIFKKLGI
ncbi:glycosyltransferase family 2 protein [Paucihalobacter sp.]|uniref:glycosyltransferase family 2 protein n=1 Tax=Paucihalobacter sp. TaxID=2850405 RepID=UPI002FE42AED